MRTPQCFALSITVFPNLTHLAALYRAKYSLWRALAALLADRMIIPMSSENMCRFYVLFYYIRCFPCNFLVYIDLRSCGSHVLPLGLNDVIGSTFQADAVQQNKVSLLFVGVGLNIY